MKGEIIAEPWIVPEAIEFLEREVIRPDMHVLETGAGGSTLYFALRCARVTTYEHKKRWANLTKKALKGHGVLDKVEMIHDPFYPEHGLIWHKTKFFDLIFIDGRGRVKSIMTSMFQLKSGGWIILDNSDRKKYQKGIRILDDCLMPRKDFKKDWMTSFWHKV